MTRGEAEKLTEKTELLMIRAQAEKMLERTGLLHVLSAYGKVAVTGSYRMDMMCWRDIDLYIEDGASVRENWFSLVKDVLCALQPHRFDGMQKGGRLFLGCETDADGEKWNVDIWVRSREQIKSAEEYCRNIMRRAQEEPELKERIMAIKNALIGLGMYGFDKDPVRHYHSNEIYKAVLEENIRTPEEFLEKYAL